MIQPLRQAHRRIWILLPVVLLIVFVAGLVVRRPSTPVNPNVRWEMLK